VPEVPPVLDDSLIDAPPPVVGEGEGDDDVVDEDGTIDPDEFARLIEERVQKRFDKAISKALRRMGGGRVGGADDPDDGDPEDDDPPGQPAGAPPAQRRRPARRSTIDTTSVRVLARDAIEDHLERAGRNEQRAVKAIVDRIAPHIDWESVDDPGEFVEDLVKSLASQAQDLVKTGSDRKVAQLRQMGALPAAAGQPAGGPAPIQGGGTAASQVAKGASRARIRWPEGKRSLHGR
jgi:hypothetical protein